VLRRSGSGEASVRRHSVGGGLGASVIVAALAVSACKTPEPKALLEVSDVETHWAVDTPSGATQFIAPVVRFKVHNKSGKAQTSVQANAVFRRKGEEGMTWGSAYELAATRQKPLPAGQDTPLMMKSDARYNSTGPPEGMFTHAEFKDAVVDVFLRVGSSKWEKFATTDIERRIGSRAAQEIVGTPAPASGAAASPSPPLYRPATPRP
jgi:hypothetical protein